MKLTAIQSQLKQAALTSDLKTLVYHLRYGNEVDTRFSSAIFLASLFKKRGKDKTCYKMLQLARHIAADDYNRLLTVNMIHEAIN